MGGANRWETLVNPSWSKMPNAQASKHFRLFAVIDSSGRQPRLQLGWQRGITLVPFWGREFLFYNNNKKGGIVDA